MAKLTYDKDMPAQRIYEALAEVAETGGHCPTNSELAEATGIETPSGISGVLRRLINRYGMIRVQGGKGYMSRRVTILATGKRTDWSLPFAERMVYGAPEVMPYIKGEDRLQGVTFTDDPRAYAAHRSGRAPTPELVAIRSSAAPDQWLTGFRASGRPSRAKKAA